MLTKTEKLAKLKEWFSHTQLDADVVQSTLNIHASSASQQVMLATSAKLIKINKGESAPDDRDNIKYARYYDVADRIKEHVEHDTGKYQAKAKSKIKQKKNLSWLHAGYFTPQVKQAAVGSGPLAMLVDEGNPAHVFNMSMKVSKLGNGGIQNSESIPDSARKVHSSTFGFIDPCAISESLDIGTVLHFTNGVKKGKDGSLYREVLDPQGNAKLLSHVEYLNSKIGIPDY